MSSSGPLSPLQLTDQQFLSPLHLTDQQFLSPQNELVCSITLQSLDSGALQNHGQAIPEPPIVTAAYASPAGRLHRHRQNDSRRRQRERIAVQHLNELIKENVIEKGRGRKIPNVTRHKSSILEAAVDIIKAQRQQIESMQNDLSLSSTLTESQVSKRARFDRLIASNELVSPRVIDALITQEKLLSSAFHNADVMQVMINAETGVCLSVNECFILQTGIPAQDLVGKQIHPTRMEWMRRTPGDECELKDSIPYHLVRCGRMVPLGAPVHTLTSHKLIAELHRGNISCAHFAFLAQLEDGRMATCVLQLWLSRISVSSQSDASQVVLTHLLCHVSV